MKGNKRGVRGGEKGCFFGGGKVGVRFWGGGGRGRFYWGGKTVSFCVVLIVLGPHYNLFLLLKQGGGGGVGGSCF